jgi:hypothetical protein
LSRHSTLLLSLVICKVFGARQVPVAAQRKSIEITAPFQEGAPSLWNHHDRMLQTGSDERAEGTRRRQETRGVNSRGLQRLARP